MDQINFTYPLEESAYWLITLFAIAYLLYLGRFWQINRKLRVSKTALLTKLIWRIAAFALVLFALMGPSFGESKREIKAIGKDIFIAVDLSQSMNAIDVQPSRLEKLKFEIKKLIQAFNSDRIGLIIFSSEAFMQCPLTFDQSALMLYFETLNSNLVPSGGTDFGAPLQMALDKLTAETDMDARPKAKMVLLISDGEDFGDDTESVVQALDDQGIKIFTLGIGTKEGGKIRQGNTFLKDRSTGEDVISKLDDRALRAIALQTDGKYFEISDSQNESSKLISAINQIEGEAIDTRTIDVTADKYYYFVLLALVMLVIDFLTPLKTVTV